MVTVLIMVTICKKKDLQKLPFKHCILLRRMVSSDTFFPPICPRESSTEDLEFSKSETALSLEGLWPVLRNPHQGQLWQSGLWFLSVCSLSSPPGFSCLSAPGHSQNTGVDATTNYCHWVAIPLNKSSHRNLRQRETSFLFLFFSQRRYQHLDILGRN